MMASMASNTGPSLAGMLLEVEGILGVCGLD